MSVKTFYLTCRNQNLEVTEEEVAKLKEDWFKMWSEMNLYIQPQVDCVVDADYFEKKKIKSQEEDDDELAEAADQEMTLEALKKDVQKKKMNLYRVTNLAGITKVRGTKQAIMNFPFQSLAAVISKRALWLVFLDSLDRGYKLIDFIHDELLTEVREDMADEVAQTISKLMVQAGRDILPFMKMVAEPCLMRRWSKDAEPAFDDNGKLIPWEDAQEGA